MRILLMIVGALLMLYGGLSLFRYVELATTGAGVQVARVLIGLVAILLGVAAFRRAKAAT